MSAFNGERFHPSSQAQIRVSTAEGFYIFNQFDLFGIHDAAAGQKQYFSHAYSICGCQVHILYVCVGVCYKPITYVCMNNPCAKCC